MKNTIPYADQIRLVSTEIIRHMCNRTVDIAEHNIYTRKAPSFLANLVLHKTNLVLHQHDLNIVSFERPENLEGDEPQEEPTIAQIDNWIRNKVKTYNPNDKIQEEEEQSNQNSRRK